MLKPVISISLALAINLNAVAAEFDIFQMPDIDTATDSTEDNQWPWKNTVSYSIGVDDSETTNINRVSWRLQTEKLVDNLFWVIDSKLRVYDERDMQHDSEHRLDYDLNLNSLYAQYSLNAYSVTVGYQTNSFGFMDLINVSNLFTPQDLSETVFTSPEDTRIGQPVINTSWYLTGSQLDIFINLSPAENRYPRSNLQDIVESFLNSTDVTLEDGLPEAFEELEAVVRWQQQLDKHEYQVYLGSLIQNDPNLKPLSLNPPFVFELEYPRFSFAAAAYSHTSGNHQLKFEASYKDNVKPIDSGNQSVDESVIALGWEYNANGAYSLLLETSRAERNLPAQMNGLIPASQIEKQFSQTAISWRKNFLNEALSANLYLGVSNPGEIDIISASIQYTPVDDWVIELIVTDIKAENNQFNIFSSYTLLKTSVYW